MQNKDKNTENLFLIYNFFTQQKNGSCQCKNLLFDGWDYSDLFYLNANQLLQKMDLVLAEIEKLNKPRFQFKTSIPGSYYVPQSMASDDLFEERRVLNLVNPIHYLRLASFLKVNSDKIINIFQNSQILNNSFFKTKLLKHQDCNLTNNNELTILHNDFLNLIKNELSISLGFRYRIVFDIIDFFTSIYTHQVADLINQWSQIQFAGDSQKIHEFSNFARLLDMQMRDCFFKQTKGIIQGPYLSTLFAELFLTLLDFFLKRRLAEVKVNYHYVRFGNYYSFFFETNRDLQLVLNIIQDLFLDNKLELNFNTLQETQSPFNFGGFVPFENIIQNLKMDKDNIQLLFEISNLQKLESFDCRNDVIKYFLRYLGTMIFNKEKSFSGKTLNEYLMQPSNFWTLFSLQQQKPELTKEIVVLLSNIKLQDNFLIGKVQNQIQNQILFALERDHWDQEVVAQIYLADHLQISIQPEILTMILKHWSKLSSYVILVTLFYLSKLVNTNATANHLILWNQKEIFLQEIFVAKKKWLDNMQKQGHPFDDLFDITQTSVWLLLYESVQRGWYKGSFVDVIDQNAFFQFLYKEKISFLE